MNQKKIVFKIIAINLKGDLCVMFPRRSLPPFGGSVWIQS